MAEKCLVERDESNRAHIYRAKIGRESTERTLVRDLLEKIFDGAVSSLVSRILESDFADEAEINRIGRLLAEVRNRV